MYDVLCKVQHRGESQEWWQVTKVRPEDRPKWKAVARGNIRSYFMQNEIRVPKVTPMYLGNQGDFDMLNGEMVGTRISLGTWIDASK